MTSTPEQEDVAPVVDPQVEPDERLIVAHDLARAALREITAESSVGPPAGYTLEEAGVVSLRFENRLPGYPGWFWTVSVARVEGEEPTVLEVELLPGDGALLAPDWVPWAVRLADYHAAQAALAEAGGDPAELDDDLADDDLDDVDDLDAADFDADGSRILHAGDVDGVDIDELADEPEDEYADEPDEEFTPDADEPEDEYGDEHDEELAPDAGSHESEGAAESER